ncbi:MAG: peptidase [Gemmatimonadetes bacterium]|nr:peptidase [Gemmatimonadota bacterium]
MWRNLLLLHRYLGIAVGLVVAAWCLSGVVMMYVPYPELGRSEELRALDPLNLDGCCTTARGSGSPDLLVSLEVIDHFVLEMSADRLVVRLVTHEQGAHHIDLTEGEVIRNVSVERAEQIALAFGQRLELGGEVEYRGAIERDQWTVQSMYHPHRPLYHFAAGDDASTEWYVSSKTGQVVLVTTGSQRFWNRLGAVVHWLYPTILRQHAAAWNQTVVWVSVLGLFLTLTGVVVGIGQLRIRTSGRRSPYRGLALWHHYAGLIFGLLTLTWLFSGLMSMNPWGALEGRSYRAERSRLQGPGLSGQQLRDYMTSLRGLTLPEHTVRLEGSVFLGRPYLLAWSADGSATRLSAESFRPEELAEADFREAARSLRPDAYIADEGWLLQEDAYYYSHHNERDFPVYRVRYEDGEHLYLDAVSGAFLHGADQGRRRYRWFFSALHSGDFSPLLRSRPLWDVVMLLLLSGVTVGAVSGVVLAKRRLFGSRR